MEVWWHPFKKQSSPELVQEQPVGEAGQSPLRRGWVVRGQREPSPLRSKIQ